MADPKLVAAIITGVLAVLLIIIVIIIALAIAAKFPAGDTKSRLQASAALSGLTALFAIGTGVAGLLYARAKAAASTSVRPLLIVMIILAVITGLMYVTIIGLNLSLRERQEIITVDKDALTASLILIAFALVSLIISIILFISIHKPAVVKKTTTTTETKPAVTTAVAAPAVTVAPATTTASTRTTRVVAKPLPRPPTRAIIPSRIVRATPAATTTTVTTTTPTVVATP